MNNQSQHNITDLTLIRYLQKQTSEKENKMIESWLILSQDNQHQLNDLKKLWQSRASVDDFDLIDIDGDWEKVK